MTRLTYMILLASLAYIVGCGPGPVGTEEKNTSNDTSSTSTEAGDGDGDGAGDGDGDGDGEQTPECLELGEEWCGHSGIPCCEGLYCVPGNDDERGPNYAYCDDEPAPGDGDGDGDGSGELDLILGNWTLVTCPAGYDPPSQNSESYGEITLQPDETGTYLHQCCCLPGPIQHVSGDVSGIDIEYVEDMTIYVLSLTDPDDEHMNCAVSDVDDNYMSCWRDFGGDLFIFLRDGP